MKELKNSDEGKSKNGLSVKRIWGGGSQIQKSF